MSDVWIAAIYAGLALGLIGLGLSSNRFLNWIERDNRRGGE